jgi:hypothetical protein
MQQQEMKKRAFRIYVMALKDIYVYERKQYLIHHGTPKQPGNTVHDTADTSQDCEKDITGNLSQAVLFVIEGHKPTVWHG